MEIKVMDPSRAPESWKLSSRFTILAHRGGADGMGWYLSWLDRDDDRHDVFCGGSVADHDQALEYARSYLDANGMN